MHHLSKLVQSHAPPRRAGTDPVHHLSELVQSHVPPRALRSSDAPTLVVPHIHTELARRTLFVAAPSTWNSLPADIWLCENILTFKRHLKTHPFKLTLSSCDASRTSVFSDLKALYNSLLLLWLLLLFLCMCIRLSRAVLCSFIFSCDCCQIN